jgi:hypothetical protein
MIKCAIGGGQKRQGTGLFFEFIVVLFPNHPSSIASFRSAIAPDRAVHYQIGDPLAVGLISNPELGWSQRKKVKFVVFGCTLAMYTCPIGLNVLSRKCLHNYEIVTILHNTMVLFLCLKLMFSS